VIYAIALTSAKGQGNTSFVGLHLLGTKVNLVSLFFVAIDTSVPLGGLSLPSAHPEMRLATVGSGVQSSKFACGIDLRFIGVSRQMGKIPTTEQKLLSIFDEYLSFLTCSILGQTSRGIYQACD